MAPCHPDRRHYARDRCYPCYIAQWKTQRPARPERHRPHAARLSRILGVGLAHQPAAYGPMQEPPRPRVVEACDKCGNRCLRFNGFEAECWACGWAAVAV